jgi:hypothetical protein
MVVADRETVSVLGNNWVNLCCPNHCAIDGMWMRSSNGKYGLTPQLENWQKVAGSRSGGGFPSSSAFVTVDSWRSDGDIQRITSSCLLHSPGLNVRSST